MDDTRIDINLRVEQYVKLRDKISEIKDRHKTELKPFNDMLEHLGGVLLQHLESTNQEASRCASGTVYRSLDESVSLADPEAFMDYITNNNAWELMDRRANKTAVKAFIEEHKSLPPGVNYSSTFKVGVRRASGK